MIDQLNTLDIPRSCNFCKDFLRVHPCKIIIQGACDNSLSDHYGHVIVGSHKACTQIKIRDENEQ